MIQSITHESQKPQRLIGLDEVRARLGGASRSSIWRWVRDGSFPAPVALGHHRIAWTEAAIDQWIAARPVAQPYSDQTLGAPPAVSKK